MLNEGKGISDVIKIDAITIWNLFLSKSYSTHRLSIGYDKIGYKEYNIEFVERNNYYSNLNIDRFRNCKITIGIPLNCKDVRVKEAISHELTHLIEIVGLNKKDYPKYWNIKKSLMNFTPKSEECKDLVHFIYKTLDNEINANVAQTYIYLENFNYMNKDDYLVKLKEYSEWIEYNNILKINKEIIKLKVNLNEIEELNNILLENNVKTIKVFNIDGWFNFWFNIFTEKSKLYLKKAERIVDEVLKKYENLDEYSTSSINESRVVDYKKYISDFNNFKNK